MYKNQKVSVVVLLSHKLICVVDRHLTEETLHVYTFPKTYSCVELNSNNNTVVTTFVILKKPSLL